MQLVPNITNIYTNIIIACLTVIVTSLIFFFSILLIPFQQYASQYTPSLFKYIRKNKKLISGFLILICIILSQVYFLYTLNIKKYVLVISLSEVIFSLLIIGYLILYVIKLINPNEFLLEQIYKCSVKELKKTFKKLRKRKKTNKEKIKEIKEMMRQAVITTEKVDEKYELFDIPIEFLSSVKKEISSLKEIIIKFIKTEQYELFKNSIDTFCNIINHYFILRKEYISNFDNFIIEISNDIEDLIKVCNKCSNNYFLKFLYEKIALISINSTQIKAIGVKNGYHYISYPFLEQLYKSIIKHILLNETENSYQAANYLGQIGIYMAKHEYTQAASKICEYLSNATIYAFKIKDYSTEYITKQHLASIFLHSLNNRKLFVNYDYPYNKTIECYEKIISSTSSNVIIGLSDPIFSWEADMIQDRSISSLIRVALFPLNYNDKIISENLNVVDNLLHLMKKYLLKDYTTQSSFLNQLYQSILWLIGFIDEEIAIKFLIYYKSVVIPNPENIKKAKLILFNTLDFIFNKYYESITNKNYQINSEDILEVLLSSYYLLIYFNLKHTLELTKQIEESLLKNIEKILDNFDRLKIGSEDLDRIILFYNYLKQISFNKKIENKLSRLIKKQRLSISSQRINLLLHIKRPIVTFDSNFFSQIDKEIFTNK